MLKSSGWKKLGSLRGPAKQRANDGAIFLKAAKMQKLRLVRMMLDGGVDVNWQNEEGYNALMCVITSHTSETEDPQASSKYTMIDFLLRLGIDPNVRDRNGKTALIHACQLNCSADIIQLLIVCNADPNIRDFSASSALDYAAAQQNEAVVKILTNACKMKKSVIFNATPTVYPKDSLMHSYLQVPKSETAQSRNGNPIGSPKLLRRQKTICCTGDDDFRRLWEEEISTPVRKKGETGAMPKGSPSIYQRRNTSAALPSISFSFFSPDEDSYLLDLDSPYYEHKRVKDSLFEWEQKSAVTDTKTKARLAWLDKYQKVLKARNNPQLQAKLDSETVKGDNKMLECAVATRIRSSSLTEKNETQLNAPVFNRSKSEERTCNNRYNANKNAKSEHKAQTDIKLQSSQTKFSKHTVMPGISTSLKAGQDVRPKEKLLTYNEPTCHTRLADLEGITPIIDRHEEPMRVRGGSKVKLAPCIQSPRRASVQVRPVHPHAQFLAARSKTFHHVTGPRLKAEELVETI